MLATKQSAFWKNGIENYMGQIWWAFPQYEKTTAVNWSGSLDVIGITEHLMKSVKANLGNTRRVQ